MHWLDVAINPNSSSSPTLYGDRKDQNINSP